MTINSPLDFAKALLNKLNLPDTPSNEQALINWQKHEGGNWNNSAKFNPLNTTQNAAGATSINKVGVKAYTSWDQGLDATAQTLNNGRYNPILNDLKNSAPESQISADVGASPWGTPSWKAGATNTSTQAEPASSKSFGSSLLPSGSTLIQVGLIILGFFVILIGLHALAQPSAPTPTPVVVGGATNAATNAKTIAGKFSK